MELNRQATGNIGEGKNRDICQFSYKNISL